MGGSKIMKYLQAHEPSQKVVMSAEAITRVRTKAAMTQQEFADALCIPIGTV
jgi:DNA-binding transcriptional regulator YiaG